jgi:hypothetical protein
VKRADPRTPKQIAIQRHTHLMTLPDPKLCRHDHRTSHLTGPHQPCGRAILTDTGAITVCDLPGEWGVMIPGIGARRRCTPCAATAIRARHFLTRQRLLNGCT